MRVPTPLAVVLAAAALSPAADKPAVVKLDSPPKPEWVAVQCDPVLTTLIAPTASVWVLVDDQPACELRAAADGKTATFAAAGDGQYRVLVIAEKEVHRVKLVRATVPPQPMPPGPGPGPPPPPTPPTPPAPTDPLTVRLQTAFDADPRAAVERTADRLLLVELYAQAATMAADSAVASTGDLVNRVRAAATGLKITGLADCRKVIGAELAAAFPDDTPLDDDARKKLAAVFAHIKACLEAVK